MRTLYIYIYIHICTLLTAVADSADGTAVTLITKGGGSDSRSKSVSKQAPSTQKRSNPSLPGGAVPNGVVNEVLAEEAQHLLWVHQEAENMGLLGRGNF